MSKTMGLLGKKVGMMQSFDQKGSWSALTAVEVGPCVILSVKRTDPDGYAAIQIAFGEQKPHRVSKPLNGVFAKAGTTPKRLIREIRLTDEEVAQFSVGQVLSVTDVFGDGDVIDVSGHSRGKGFQGVMRRHHFRGTRATHGTHEYFRHGGSLGCRLTPGRVSKGKKMPGQMGNKRATIQNLRVNRTIPEKNLILIKGSVPGAPDGFLEIKHAVKAATIPFVCRKPAPAEATPAAETEAAAE